MWCIWRRRCSVRFCMISSNLGFYPLGAPPFPPQLWKQNCLQTVPKVGLGAQNLLLLKTTDVAFNKCINLDSPSKNDCDISYYNSKSSKFIFSSLSLRWQVHVWYILESSIFYWLLKNWYCLCDKCQWFENFKYKESFIFLCHWKNKTSNITIHEIFACLIM